MRAYVHDEKTDGKLLALCEATGIDILTSDQVRRRKKLPEQYDFFLDQVDVLIMEITKPTQDIHFILAQAILADKPVLCVYAKNQSPRELLRHINKKPAPRPIKTFSYTGNTLGSVVIQFIRTHDPEAREHDEKPSIKFTIRLTPRNERYISWYSERYALPKADAIRKLLDERDTLDPDFPENAAK